MMSKSVDSDNIMQKYLRQGIYGTYYFLHRQERQDQNALVLANPNLSRTRELWNMLDNKYIMSAFEVILPSVSVNRKILIPMLDTIITRENINSLNVFESSDVNHEYFERRRA